MLLRMLKKPAHSTELGPGPYGKPKKRTENRVRTPVLSLTQLVCFDSNLIPGSLFNLDKGLQHLYYFRVSPRETPSAHLIYPCSDTDRSPEAPPSPLPTRT